MDEFIGKEADLEFSKRKTNSRSKHHFLRSAKQTKDAGFELLGKCKIERNPDISQDSSSKEVPHDVKEAGKNQDTNKILSNENVNQQNEFLSDFNEARRNEHKKSEEPIQVAINSDEERNKAASLDIKEKNEKPDTDKTLAEKKINAIDEVLNTDMEYDAVPDHFNTTVGLDGKNVIQNDEMPFTKRYDLAVERNKKRFSSMKKTGFDNEMLRRMEKDENASESDKKKNAMIKRGKNINMACYLTELNSKILKKLSHDKINEIKILSYLKKILVVPITPTCLLYVPHLVHTISFIRGNKSFNKVLRLAANECYNRCHVMFPIPHGCNFETVYTSEMRKFLPDDFEKLESIPFDYGDIDDLYESCDPDDYNILIQMLYNPLTLIYSGNMNRAFRISLF